MSNPSAVRPGDDIIHTSIPADILERAFGTATCVVVGVVVVVAAAPLVVAAATAAGVSVVMVAAASVVATTCTAVGIVGGLTVSLSGVVEVVGGIAQGAASFTSPPSSQGKIATGSLNVQANDLPAAKAVGRLTTTVENVTREEMEAEEKTRREEEDARMSTGMKALNGVSALFSYSSELLGELINPVVAKPSGGVVETGHDVVLREKHPPNPIQLMVEGSSQVSISGLPAVHTGDRTTCGGTISTVVFPNVIIGGKPVVARPIHSGKSPGVETALLALSVLTCRPVKLLKQLLCTIMGMAAVMLASKTGESVRALRDPAYAVTGAKALSGEKDYDFELPARLPLVWQRIYNSCNPHKGLFGRGRRAALETRVAREEEYTCFHGEGGRELRFVCPPPGEAGFGPDEGPLFAQSKQGMMVTGDLDGATQRFYPPHPLAPSQLCLYPPSDNYGNGLQLHHDKQDRLQAITDAQESLRVALRYQDLHSPQRPTRITEHMLTSAPPGGELVHRLLMSYDRTPQGELCHVTDADDVCLRESDYTPGALMVGHWMPGGARHRYQWKKPSDGWRVVAHESSGGDSATIGYDLTQGATTVTHGGGETYRHEWSHHYLVEEYTDKSGQVWGYGWNEDGQFSCTVDPLGTSRAYHYDNAGNVILETDPLGRAVCTRWLEDRALPVQASGPGGSVHQHFYDANFGLRAEIDALGLCCYYRRDERGQVVEFIDEKGDIQCFSRNECGQFISAQDCSGRTTQYRYDAAYRLVEEVDAAGESIRYVYSPAGRLKTVSGTEDWTASLSWTAQGLPESYRVGHNNPVRWQYDICGRVSAVTDPLGHIVRHEYDARNRLTCLYNESGELYRFIHGINGYLAEERGLDGIITRYEYNACDRMISKTWVVGAPDVLTHRWQYNAVGEVTDKQAPDRHTTYRYTTGGTPQTVLFYPPGAESLTQRVLLEHDRPSRLTAEENDSGRMNYSPDEPGNQTSAQLPDGRSLKTLYYGNGHALSISLDERLITEFTRDNLYREISRTQGGLTTRTCYNRLGRQARRDIYREENGMWPVEVWHWQYDSRHNLLSETQISDYRYQGYHYDDGDRICRHDTSFRGVTHHTYDAAGNLLTAPRAGQSLTHNRQMQCGNGACRYDVHGRMARKPGPRGTWCYGYGSEHRMTEAVLDTPDATGAGNMRHRVTSAYDPFGRRTEKRSEVTVSAPDDGCVTGVQEVITSVREGFRLLAETHNGQPLVYVYEGVGSHTPLARVHGTGDRQCMDYYRCSHNGMPQALTDEDGRLHRCQDVETWGEARSEYADEEGGRWRKIWGDALEEDLRFVGQHLDRETGLHYNTFRYCAPDTGRFITPDPIGPAGGIDPYSYVPNPLSWIDPSGLLKCGLTGNEVDDASNLPVIKPGTKEWKLAVDTMRNNGSGKPNFRAAGRNAAEKLLKDTNSKIPEYGQYTGSKNYRDKVGYEHHPNEPHTVNASENNLLHVKWSDYSAGEKASGSGKGHIFYG